MKAAIVALVLCALFAVSFANAQSGPAEAARFAETDAEDAGVLAEQEQMFEDSLDLDETEDEDESEIQSADEDEAEDQDEVEGEDEDEAEDEGEDEEETEEEQEAEADEEEAAEDEQEEEAEEEDEQEDEQEEGTEAFVLAELLDNPKFTGFMQMTAEFIPTESAEAEHLVHSLSSHQQALAHQQYSVGYAHGMADATAPAAPKAKEDEEDEQDADEEEAEEGEEAAFVEQSGSPQPVYGFPGQFPTIAGYNSGPTGHGFIARPYYTSVAPPPPPVPTWLPPPPYIPPAPAAGGKDDE